MDRLVLKLLELLFVIRKLRDAGAAFQSIELGNKIGALIGKPRMQFAGMDLIVHPLLLYPDIGSLIRGLLNPLPELFECLALDRPEIFRRRSDTLVIVPRRAGRLHLRRGDIENVRSTRHQLSPKPN